MGVFLTSTPHKAVYPVFEIRDSRLRLAHIARAASIPYKQTRTSVQP
jgi:hypothetical protein